jgi:hypothetical protein
MPTIYVVKAVRILSPHEYLVGVYSKKQKALNAAATEEDFRGGNKYSCEILEVSLDKGIEGNHSTPFKKIKAAEVMY